MNPQPRVPAGTRTSGQPSGGRWASKPVPDIDNGAGFDSGVLCSAACRTKHTVKLWGLSTTFERSISDNGEVSVTTDCDDPTLLLLARKGDKDYWCGNTWTNNHEDRRTWSADIACRMLDEGLVATTNRAGDEDGSGIRLVMDFATSNVSRDSYSTPHVLTAAVAQIRTLRLLQSMAPTNGWETKLDAYRLPRDSQTLLSDRFTDVLNVYSTLPRPPWTDPPGVPWGLQHTAGHATSTHDGTDVFVGEHSDLIWRALTEPDHHGNSPLKEGIPIWSDGFDGPGRSEMLAAAALYDNIAEQQLTTGLFDGVDPEQRHCVQERIQEWFRLELNPPFGDRSRWTVEQTERIKGFVDLVEALEP